MVWWTHESLVNARKSGHEPTNSLMNAWISGHRHFLPGTVGTYRLLVWDVNLKRATLKIYCSNLFRNFVRPIAVSKLFLLAVICVVAKLLIAFSIQIFYYQETSANNHPIVFWFGVLLIIAIKRFYKRDLKFWVGNCDGERAYQLQHSVNVVFGFSKTRNRDWMWRKIKNTNRNSIEVASYHKCLQSFL